MKNMKYFAGGLTLELAVSSGVTSGDPVAIGQLAGVAVTDRDSDGNASVLLPVHIVITTDVTGADASGNAAVAIGDKLYKDGTEVNKDSTNGTPYGYALEAVSSGATTSIQVALATF